MLSTELHQDQIPLLFQRFRAAIGEQYWLGPAQDVISQVEQWPYLRDHFVSLHRVILTLRACSIASDKSGGALPWELTSSPVVIESSAFISQVLQLIDAARGMSNKRANILIARVREAFRSPRMLQAMQLETRIAVHFLIAGLSAVFPELGSGSDTFDVLIEDLGPTGLEIECKVITSDKGRKIHRTDALHFLGRLQSSPLIQSSAKQLQCGLAIRVTVPNRLPPLEGLDQFLADVQRSILEGAARTELQGGASVVLTEFDPVDLGPLRHPDSEVTRDAVERIVGKSNSHHVIFRAKENRGGVVVAVVDSAKPDSMLHEMFETFAESAARQLTSRRAGALMATFEGIGSSSMLNIASSEGRGGNYSELAWKASAFLEKPNFPYLIGIGFLSEPDFSNGASSTGGVTYWIPKPTSPMWSPEFIGLFGVDPRQRLASSR